MIFFFSYTDHQQHNDLRPDRSSSNEELSLVKAGSSETVELPRSSVYSIHVSGKAANGTSFSNTFSGTIDNSSSVTISLDDSANLSMIANIAD